MNTPREVLFESMHVQWGISNKNLAHAIVLHESVTSGKSPVELIEVRSSLSRFVVHVQPGENVYGWIAPFEQSVPRVMALVKKSKKPHSSQDVLDALAGDIAVEMRASFDFHGIDGSLFSNMMSRIAGGEVASIADAAEVALALHVVAGSTGDAREAARYALGLMRRLAMAAELRTRVSSGEMPAEEAVGPVQLALFRSVKGTLSGSPHRLSAADEGTEVGSLSLEASSINDVGEGVSRRHARIWRDGQGAWWIEGLGSTNGTVLFRDSERIVVEPTRSQRKAGQEAQRVEIHPGDRIVLAGTTEFTVMALSS